MIRQKRRNDEYAGRRIQRREEAQRRDRLRQAKRRDIDADLPLYLKRPHLTKEVQE